MIDEASHKAVVLNGGFRDGEVWHVRKCCLAVSIPILRSVFQGPVEALVYRQRFDGFGHPAVSVENGQECFMFQLESRFNLRRN